MDTWRGHFPITSIVLYGLLDKAQSRGDEQFSEDERVLFTACEFWAAAANRSLDEHLGGEPVERLRAAQAAFARIGAVRVANTLGVAADYRLGRPMSAPPSASVTELEQRLLKTADKVDDLISAFAAERLLNGSWKVERK
jgi:hypothetical protein